MEIFKVNTKYPEITGKNAEKFRSDLLKLETEVDGELTVDLEGIGIIGSIGISAILSTYQNLNEHGKKMSVVNACEKNLKIFEMMNMSKIITDDK